MTKKFPMSAVVGGANRKVSFLLIVFGIDNKESGGKFTFCSRVYETVDA